MLVVAGVVLAIVGLLIWAGAFRWFGKLPGDIRIERPNSRIYIPLGSSLLLAAHQVGDYEPTVVSSFGSQNLTGGLPDSLATVLTIVQVLAVIALWILFATRRGYPEELTAASAAVVAAFIAFGKVLSPQFLIWLVPLVPLVLGGLGLVAAGLFVLVLVLTQLWFPRTYWELVAFDAGPSWLLLARDLALVALVAVLAAAIGRVGGRTKRGLTQA